MARKRVKEIHKSIRSCLGYEADEPVKDIVSDWKVRTSNVCKPCWELKYCPYGPLVEQSPLLPSVRAEAVRHNEYLKSALDAGLLGDISPISEERRDLLSRILADEDLAHWVAWNKLKDEALIESAQKTEDPVGTWMGPELPPIHEYRVSYDLGFEDEFDLDSIPESLRARLKAILEQTRVSAKSALSSGIEDTQMPLDAVRREWFQKVVDNFDPDDHPDEIPDIFMEAGCNFFGHICPVFFAAEAITETSEARRRGRYIPFTIKIRVVRRDNYTCQECGTHLKDYEVEFDHIIPLSRGGSTEEHNIRLTCFDCNRNKSAEINI